MNLYIKFVEVMHVRTSQLVSLQLHGGILGPIQIVLTGSLLNEHVHFTTYAIRSSKLQAMHNSR